MASQLQFARKYQGLGLLGVGHRAGAHKLSFVGEGLGHAARSRRGEAGIIQLLGSEVALAGSGDNLMRRRAAAAT